MGLRSRGIAVGMCLAIGAPASIAPSNAVGAAGVDVAGDVVTAAPSAIESTTPAPLPVTGTAIGEPLVQGDVPSTDEVLFEAPGVEPVLKSLDELDREIARRSPAVETKGFVPGRSVEERDLRERFSSTYQNPDGSNTTVFESLPVNYPAKDGSWAISVACGVGIASSALAVTGAGFAVRASTVGASARGYSAAVSNRSLRATGYTATRARIQTNRAAGLRRGSFLTGSASFLFDAYTSYIPAASARRR